MDKIKTMEKNKVKNLRYIILACFGVLITACASNQKTQDFDLAESTKNERSTAAFDNEETLISIIQNRRTDQEVRYYRKNNNMVFKLYEQGQETILKEVTIEKSANEVRIRGKRDFSFPILSSTFKASGEAYDWCFNTVSFDDSLPAAYAGIYALGVGIAATMSLCAVLPGMPAVLGIALLPVDGVVTAIGLLSAEQRAERKFEKMIQGNSKKINDRAFKKLLAGIDNL